MYLLKHFRNTAMALGAATYLVACAATVEPETPVVVPGAVDLSAKPKEPVEVKPLSPEEQARVDAVRARSQARLAALMKRDYAQAYKFSTPAWRDLNDLDRFRGANEGSRSWQAAEVRKVDCSAPDQCEVRVRVDTRIFTAGTGLKRANITTHFSEVWLHQDKEWWYVQNR